MPDLHPLCPKHISNTCADAVLEVLSQGQRPFRGHTLQTLFPHIARGGRPPLPPLPAALRTYACCMLCIAWTECRCEGVMC